MEEVEAEGIDTADSGGKAKVLRLGWVSTQFWPGVPVYCQEKGRQDLGVRGISFLYGEKDGEPLGSVLAKVL